MRAAARCLLAALVAAHTVPARAAPPPATRDDLICRANSGVSYSYDWGGACWCADGCEPSSACDKGGCSGDNHWGMGADCSGFVNHVWQVPEAIALSTCYHGPYVAADFRYDGPHWDGIDRSQLERGDALASSGHVVLYHFGDRWGSMMVYEAKGCDYGIVHNTRTTAGYTASRRHNLVDAPNCDPRHHTRKCSGGDAYWYDACGEKNDLAQSCDDKNPCTDDCRDGVCDHRPNQGACDDGNACTTGDHCEAGKCVRGTPRDCSGLDEKCFEGKCVAGKCEKVPRYNLPQERCNGQDENCDGVVDEGCDKDRDGWCTVEMVCEGTSGTCPKGCGDCDDHAGGAHPGASEACNGNDDDCDGVVDEGFPDSDDDLVVDCRDDDDDGDGVKDADDNCDLDPNPVQVDTDHDGAGDVCDQDDDGDGVPDDGDGSGAFNDRPCDALTAAGCDDNCRTVANSAATLAPGIAPELGAQADTDGDGVGDACDPDLDGDGVPNASDVCPRWPDAEQADHDKDAAWAGGENWRFPGLDASSGDPRHATGGDACDVDDDNDGVPDDGDGIEGGVACVSGVLVGCDDNCPFVANGAISAGGMDAALSMQSDADGDTLGDACDPDMDSDGVPNEVDLCPRWPDPEQLDHDGDAAGGDGANLSVPGGGAAPDERLTAGGDACDTDDDGDGVPDDGDGSGVAGDAPCISGQRSGCDDNCPFVANSAETVAGGLDPLLGDQSDVDGDGDGDPCDTDMDGDGVPDEVDVCPRWQDPAQVDHDGDGKPTDGLAANLGFPEAPHAAGDARGLLGGDECDADDDGDGILDPVDNCPFVANSDVVASGVDPLLGGQSDVDGDGLGDACDPDMDGDQVPNEEDRCPRWQDPDQADADADAVLGAGANLLFPGITAASAALHGESRGGLGGDECDLDDDNDRVPDALDNCRTVANGHDVFRLDREAGQVDHDSDGAGDACDEDDDGDGVLDDGDGDGVPGTGFGLGPAAVADCDRGEVPDQGGDEPRQCLGGKHGGCDDNCPFVGNPDQSDTDGDANPADDVWDFVPLYEGDEPCDHDDDGDGLLDEDEVRCGTGAREWDTDGDGYSDFVELYPAAWDEVPAEVAPPDEPRWLDHFCCTAMEGDQRDACLAAVSEHLLAEARRRACEAPAPGTGPRVFATDPLWDKDSPDHHIAPADPLGGGACTAGPAASGGHTAFLLLALAAFLAARRRGCMSRRRSAPPPAGVGPTGRTTGGRAGAGAPMGLPRSDRDRGIRSTREDGAGARG